MKLNKYKPPGLITWLVAKCLNSDYLEEFLGDLQEIFEDRVEQKGKTLARLIYCFDAFHLLIGFASFSIFKTQNSNIIMIKTMFRMAYRSAIRQKQFTILNVLGLTIGITTSLFIGLYVYNETTYDAFHEKGDRIYRVNQPMIWNSWDEQFSSTGPNVALALKAEIPEFEELTRLLNLGSQTIRVKGESGEHRFFKETSFFGAEENFLNVFTFNAIQGDIKSALNDPLSIVITKETAEKYFGFGNVIGKSIEVKRYDGVWEDFIVKAVIENVPKKSHIQFDILSSFKSYPEMFEDNEWKWNWTSFSTYALVKKGADIAQLVEKMQAIPPKYAAATTERVFKQSFEDFTKGNLWTLYLQPLSDIYLSSAPDWHRFGPTGKPQPVRIFGAIGLIILVLSSINFMNLSTARSTNRAKEIGVRKVLGSRRKALVHQFIFESILFVAISTVLALVLVSLTIDPFNALAQRGLTVRTIYSSFSFIAVLIGFVLGLGVLAGSYPAFYLSSFRPIQALKGKVNTSFRGKGFRNGLVVFQFTMSIALIICTFFVQRQLQYASSLDIGIDRDNVLQIHNIEQLDEKADVLKSKLLTNPAITHLGTSYATPTNVWDGERYKASHLKDAVSADMSNFRTKEDYLELLGVEFVAGRNFDPEIQSDKYGAILNETAVKALGWGTTDSFIKDSPIGKKVICDFDNELELQVLGVVKDFNFNTIKEEIEPLVIMHSDNDSIWNYGLGRSYISLRLNPIAIQTSEDLQVFLESIEKEIYKIDPSTMFEYSFMDHEFEATFRSELQMGKILNLFSIMALIIACLGLFGLAAFSAEQRMKELGIRKVLGARVISLVVSFSSEFTRLIVIAIVLAIPVSYLLVNRWLSSFAYRTPIEAWVFTVAILCAFIIACTTIGYQSLAAANKNPAEVLKDE